MSPRDDTVLISVSYVLLRIVQGQTRRKTGAQSFRSAAADSGVTESSVLLLA